MLILPTCSFLLQVGCGDGGSFVVVVGFSSTFPSHLPPAVSFFFLLMLCVFPCFVGVGGVVGVTGVVRFFFFFGFLGVFVSPLVLVCECVLSLLQLVENDGEYELRFHVVNQGAKANQSVTVQVQCHNKVQMDRWSEVVTSSMLEATNADSDTALPGVSSVYKTAVTGRTVAVGEHSSASRLLVQEAPTPRSSAPSGASASLLRPTKSHDALHTLATLSSSAESLHEDASRALTPKGKSSDGEVDKRSSTTISSSSKKKKHSSSSTSLAERSAPVESSTGEKKKKSNGKNHHHHHHHHHHKSKEGGGEATSSKKAHRRSASDSKEKEKEEKPQGEDTRAAK
jgi:hypothetical protein